jgi:hypothetical protein
MSDQKQPDTPGIGGETFKLTLSEGWYTPMHYTIGIDLGNSDLDTAIMSTYCGNSLVHSTTFSLAQLKETMKFYGPYPLFTYTITGAISWMNHYVAEEQRTERWLGSMANNHRITIEARFNQHLYNQGLRLYIP